jgi:hypothetical protein
VDVLGQSLAEAEFLAVDCETNGRAGEACELTEVAAVLVGGGELHDSLSSLTAVEAPLTRGVQRLTGITQAMLDRAPPPGPVLAQLVDRLEDRVLVAHSASPQGRSVDVFWMLGGRLREWRTMCGPDLERPAELTQLAEVTGRVLALGTGDGLGAHLPSAEIDEVRIMAGWLAAHPDTPLLPLEDVPSASALCDFLAPIAAHQ